MRPIALVAFALTILAVGACARSGSPGTYQQIEEAVSAGIPPESAPAGYEAPADEVTRGLLPPISLDVQQGRDPAAEPRFDIKVNRVEAREFFVGLVEGTPYNMVVHPDVAGRLSLDLKNVTVPEVMQTVRNVYGYYFERSRTGFEVFPNTIRSRLFKVDYLTVSRSGQSRIRVSAGQVTEVVGEGRREGEAGQQDRRAGSAATSNIETSSDSDFWAELRAALQAIVGTEDGRSVVVNPHAGAVLVRAMPDELKAVDNFLSAVQGTVERQVILEAKILEVQLSKGYQSGINWAGLHERANDRLLLGQIGGGNIFNGNSSIAGNSGVLDPGNLSQVEGTATSAFGGVFTAALSIGSDFTAFIELLETQGQVHVLSSPRVSTVNNQKAVIKVGSDEFFVTDLRSSTNVTTGALSTQNNVELTPFFSGVALDVFPQVSEAGYITLHIHPTVSEVREQIKNVSVSSTDAISLPLAVSTIRESDTVVRARSGQVVVIGGLMQNTTEDEVAGVPLLGDLPLIGGLFRHTRQVERKSELVILLRPVVVEGDQQWADALRSSRRAFQELAPDGMGEFR